MIKELQVAIKNPCSENWGQMSPNANGRFCSSCQKTVLDKAALVIGKYFYHQSPRSYLPAAADTKTQDRFLDPCREFPGVKFLH
jgi:hypothetical protein